MTLAALPTVITGYYPTTSVPKRSLADVVSSLVSSSTLDDITEIVDEILPQVRALMLVGGIFGLNRTNSDYLYARVLGAVIRCLDGVDIGQT